MQYLVDRYDTEHKVSYPRDTKEHWEVNSWLHWQMGGLGPMQGQANHFARYAPEKIQYGIDRYQNETKRLYGVLEKQLEKSESGYLVGDRITIADLACWGWVAGHRKFNFPFFFFWLTSLSILFRVCNQWRGMKWKADSTNQKKNITDWAGVSLDKFPHLEKWIDTVLSRPACEKGRHVPTKHTLLDLKHLSEEELDKRAEKSRNWVQKGMAEDAKK